MVSRKHKYNSEQQPTDTPDRWNDASANGKNQCDPTSELNNKYLWITILICLLCSFTLLLRDVIAYKEFIVPAILIITLLNTASYLFYSWLRQKFPFLF